MPAIPGKRQPWPVAWGGAAGVKHDRECRAPTPLAGREREPEREIEREWGAPSPETKLRMTTGLR
jgi:hypothetical protein